MQLNPVIWLKTLGVLDDGVQRFPFVGVLSLKQMVIAFAAFWVISPMLNDRNNYIIIPCVLVPTLFFMFYKGKTFRPEETIVNWLAYVGRNHIRRRRRAATAGSAAETSADAGQQERQQVTYNSPTGSWLFDNVVFAFQRRRRKNKDASPTKEIGTQG